MREINEKEKKKTILQLLKSATAQLPELWIYVQVQIGCFFILLIFNLYVFINPTLHICIQLQMKTIWK